MLEKKSSQKKNQENKKKLIKAFIVVGSIKTKTGTAYLAGEKNGKPVYKGFTYDVWKKLKEDLSSKYEFEEIYSKKDDANYNKFIKDMSEGKYDILIGAVSPTTAREKIVNYTSPIIIDANAIFHLDDDTIFSRFGDSMWQVGKFVIILLLFGLIAGLILYIIEPNRGGFLPSINNNKRLPKMNLKHLNIRRSLLTTIAAFLGEMGFLAENSTLTILGIGVTLGIIIIAFMLIMFIQSEITANVIDNKKGFDNTNIKGNTFLGITGYDTGTSIEKHGGNMKYIDDSSIEKLIKLYIKYPDKYEGVAASYVDLEPFLKEYPNSKISYEWLGRSILYFTVNQKNPKFLFDINQEIIRLKNSLYLQKICHRYFENKEFCALT